MNANDLLRLQIEDAGYQLDKALTGLPEELTSFRFENGMTPFEQVTHLTEAYVALEKMLAGAEHEWGSYTLEGKSWPEALETMKTQRATTSEKVLKGDDDAIKKGTDFIVGHDYYHVGQLAAIRVAKDPAWDPMSIYRM